MSNETNLKFNLSEEEFNNSQYSFNLTRNLSLKYSSQNYYIFFKINSTNSHLSKVEIFFTNNFIAPINCQIIILMKFNVNK